MSRLTRPSARKIDSKPAWLLTISLLGAALPLQASARSRVAVIGFSGPGAGSAAAVYQRTLKRGSQVIGVAAVRRTANQVGAATNLDAGRAMLCSKLRCSALVRGSVKKRGRYYTVSVTVYDGSNGRALGTRRARARGRRGIASAAARIAQASLALIRRGSAGQAAASPPPAAPADDDRGADDERPDELDKPAAKKPDRRRADDRDKDDDDADDDKDDDDKDDDKDDDGAEGSDEGPAVSRRSSEAGKGDIFDISVSLGLATRTGKSVGPADNDGTYDGGLYPEFAVDLGFYPLMFLTKGFVRNLGLGATYSRPMTISTKLPSAASDVETSAQELLIDLRLRWRWWNSPTSPTLLGLVGWGLRDFNLAVNPVLSSFNYRFLRFGANITVPLGSPLIGLLAGADVRPILGVGKEALDNYGSKGSGALGWAVRAGLHGRHQIGLFYFLTLEYLKFSASFAGGPIPAALQNPNAHQREDASESTDTYIRVLAGVGYALER